IRARRISTAERTWRWCRRNPILAAMTASAFFLGVVSLCAAIWLKQVAERASQAEQSATERLVHSSVAEARANRDSGKIGQKYASLRALRQAVESAKRLGLGAGTFRELRDAAIASLAMLDLELEREWEGNPPGTNGLAFDSAYERYARSHQDGSISLRRVADDTEVVRFQSTEPDPADRRVDLQFGGDDRFLVVSFMLRKARPVFVFDLNAPASPRWSLPDSAGFRDFSAAAQDL